MYKLKKQNKTKKPSRTKERKRIHFQTKEIDKTPEMDFNEIEIND